MAYKIDPEKCVGCCQCKDACGPEAISEVDGKCVIDANVCASCGNCASVCPVEAIAAE